MNGFCKTKMINILLGIINVLYLIMGLSLIRKSYFASGGSGLGTFLVFIIVVIIFMLLYATLAVIAKSKFNTRSHKIVYWINNVLFITISIGFISFVLSV